MNPMSICSSSSSSSSSKSWIVHGLVAGAAITAAIGAHMYFSLTRTRKFRTRVIGIIPARFASSRFQGKPLVQILGKPMIQLWQQMMTRLQNAVEDLGGDVIMTSESCRNGAECCSEALQKLNKKYDIVVNIQGDEPLIEPEIINGIVKLCSILLMLPSELLSHL